LLSIEKNSLWLLDRVQKHSSEPWPMEYVKYHG